ncbi:MAG: hypothetical protein U9N63_15860 [Pseudomonadota bacterium]|nr:hypothetical protein [Pseudomonadota bacterium]
MKRICKALVIMSLVLFFAVGAVAQTADPLPSWNEGKSKQAIVKFVEDVTTSGSADFVPAPERIAVFDNDGTLWSEQPMYFQLAFALDRVKTLAPQHPEWKDKQPFKAALEGDMQMLQWTTAGSGARFGGLVHHTVAEREYAYDKDSPIGRLNKALTDAETQGWIVVDMKKEWKVIFPAEKEIK